MKKLLSLVLALMLVAALGITAYAENNPYGQNGTTLVTTEVPVPQYQIHIPADTTIEYGNTAQVLVGSYYVDNVENFGAHRQLRCKVTVTDLINTADSSKTIAISYTNNSSALVGEIDLTMWSPSGTYINQLNARVQNWENAEPGAYKSTITFEFYVCPFNVD